ncbi:hypothetical protein [Pleionea sp. CnH1-48]|uniref:hypothetical protein n=1 Tax=Pleionea sp. CnH1-48 TaxID=2954494 RepID=UPI002097D968|nr:hypothetical protein [Pleionea sp. CnH1-48]MCO7225793.1 hypothetical protein [Pleionea sp. CnH1-48]
MSTVSFELKFNASKFKKNNRDKFESIYKSYVPKNSEEQFFNYRDDSAHYISNFVSPEEVDLASLLADLEAAGARESLIIGWYSSTGENTYHIRKNGKILDFDSLEEMNEHLREIEKEQAAIKINYGKKTINQTLLVRLHVKAKGKRKKHFELFDKQLKEPEQNFKEIFDSVVKAETHDIEWGRFKWKEDSSWNFAFTDGLIDTLIDVQEDDEFILLAFDLDKKEITVDDFIWFVFFGLDGVRKVWVKYRKGSHQLYLHEPGMGDEAFFIDKTIENDNDWPKL